MKETIVAHFFLCLNGLVGGFVLDTFLTHFSYDLVDFKSPTDARVQKQTEINFGIIYKLP